MVFNLRDRGKRYLNYFPIRTLHFYTWGRKNLSGFHAVYGSSHACAIGCNDLNVIFPVKWLQGRQRFGDYHSFLLLPIAQLEDPMKTLKTLLANVQEVYRGLNRTTLLRVEHQSCQATSKRRDQPN